MSFFFLKVQAEKTNSEFQKTFRENIFATAAQNESKNFYNYISILAIVNYRKSVYASPL